MTGLAYLQGWTSMNTASRDAAYDNMAAVAGSEHVAARWQRLSDAFRQGRRGWRTLHYGPRPRNVIDFYPGRPGAPWLVFVHGGYWLRNRAADFGFVAQGLAQHGWSAAIVGYTLAPDARLTEIAGEIRIALDFLGRERDRLYLTGPMLLSGWSAGATLALLQADHPLVDHVLAISGLYDLGPLRDTSMNRELRIDAHEAIVLSPVHRPPPNVSVTLAVGDHELPAIRASTEAMAQALARGSARHAVRRIAGADHFSILDELASPQGELARLAR